MAWENTKFQYNLVTGANPILDDGLIEFVKNGNGVEKVKTRSLASDLLLTPTSVSDSDLEAEGQQTSGGVTYPMRLVLRRALVDSDIPYYVLHGYICRHQPHQVGSEDVECMGEVEGET